MFLNKNYEWLSQSYKYIAECVKKKAYDSVELEIENSRVGVSTLKVKVENKQISIHSKYDPIREANNLIEKYSDEIEEYTHVFFYGLGLGYHIERFIDKYPAKTYLFYEPIPSIFEKFLEEKSLEKISENLNGLFVEFESNLGKNFLSSISSDLRENTLLIILPSYETAFPEKVEQFLINFKDVVQQKKLSFGAELTFSKRWTLNSLMNLPTTLSTPNIIKDKAGLFKDKPVLLVSAGPSLEYEYDNLRLIKQEGSAYIFAVGSANKALIANNILPDAVCTYDPQSHNFNVFREMIEKGVDTVPMIYGTSVGYETIQKYKGPKLHVVTSQDTITHYYTVENEIENVIDDAFSIAIITLQILAKMNVGLVILVGQNFAFLNENYYASDIKRGREQTSEILDEDRVDYIEVNDVYGNAIKTNYALNQMKLLMEQYIALYSYINIINTTNWGADIKGAPFVPLSQVITNFLNKRVVEKEWYNFEQNGKSPTKSLKRQIKNMEHSIDTFVLAYNEIFNVLNDIDKAIDNKNNKHLDRLLLKFDNQFQRLTKTNLFSIFIRPITRVYFENLLSSVKHIRKENDSLRKGLKIIQSFGTYLHICNQAYNYCVPLLQNIVHPSLKAECFKEQWKMYYATSPQLDYSSEWERKVIESNNKNRKETLYTYFESRKAGAKVQFKFNGRALRIIGGKSSRGSKNISIEIDGVKRNISTFSGEYNSYFPINFQQVLFEENGLENKEHKVQITVLNDDLLVIQGIELEVNGRLLHPQETTNFQTMEVGERIRCNIDEEIIDGRANISKIGEETSNFICTDSGEYKGDFYLMKVWKGEEGNAKFISDVFLPLDSLIYKDKIYLLNKIPQLKTNNNPVIKISSSSYYKNLKYSWLPYKAFNKRIKGYVNAWATDKGVTTGWIEIELKDEALLNCYTMVNQESHYSIDTTKRMPKKWTFEAWDGKKWFELDKQNMVEDWVDKKKKFFVFENEIKFLKYRFNISNNNGDMDFLAIGEIELL